ncbi:cysteine proteinase inhibitor 1 [Quercus suber]|uniref:Cysteine proteinase inhibitor 1 n=1 Tax=Quercus suber TaxID=58331 RepID=A0AAW0K9K4_QUESU
MCPIICRVPIARELREITNINDNVKKIGQFAVFKFNRRSNSNLLFERFSDGFYYRPVLEAKHGAYTKNYQAIVLDQPWAYLGPSCHKASLFGAANNMGKCIVAIVEDLLAPKIINTLVPLLFALRAVSNSAINSGSAAKLIFR